MERRTMVHAEAGQQQLMIVRDFDLPLELLFKAYEDAELFAEWMGTRVLKMENRSHGSYAFETSNPEGTVVFRANGSIHEFVRDKKITRTFEMENTPFSVQLEFLEFESTGEESSRLTIQILFRSVMHRDQLLQMPFAQGIDRAHNRLQEIVQQKNKQP